MATPLPPVSTSNHPWSAVLDPITLDHLRALGASGLLVGADIDPSALLLLLRAEQAAQLGRAAAEGTLQRPKRQRRQPQHLQVRMGVCACTSTNGISSSSSTHGPMAEEVRTSKHASHCATMQQHPWPMPEVDVAFDARGGGAHDNYCPQPCE